jgi:hypothetical protein
MERNTITRRDGLSVDITKQVDQLLDICGSGDLITSHEMDFIQSFGKAVIATAGQDALAGLVDELGDDVTPEFADFLRAFWIDSTIRYR